MSYHDNDHLERRRVRQAEKELDPGRYGEDVAEKIAEECCEKLEKAVNADPDISEERGRSTIKEIIKETVKENL